MRFFITLCFLLIIFNLTGQKITYPNSYPDNNIIDDYFGTKVKDPYRWLEDENSDNIGEWIKKQRVLTEEKISEIPFRDKIKNQLTDNWDFESRGIPSKHGNMLIYSKRKANENQYSYYISENGKEEILIDANKLSKDGTVNISSFSVSHNNRFAAYAISKSGSDWKTIYVIDLSTKKQLRDSIEWIKFSGISWFKDGFFYSGYEAPKKGKEYSTSNEFQKVFYHKLGTLQKDDEIIFQNKKEPKTSHYCSVTEDEKFLILYSSKGTSGNNLKFKDLTIKNADFKTITDGYNSETWVVDNTDETITIVTNKNAANKRVARFHIEAGTSNYWEDIIPEKEYVLESINNINNKYFVTYLKDVKSKVEVYTLNGDYIDDLELPEIGVTNGVHGKKTDNVGYLSFRSYTTPPSIYEVKSNELVLEEYFTPKINIETNSFVSKQVFYMSKDGTKIPMFITYKKGTKLDGSAPCLLYGYGGFNISYKPSFDIAKLTFVNNGGIYAVANLRGGSEYGEKWHKAGMKENKQNVFDDFIAAAEFLKANNYTSTDKLAIHGRSNGGLLVGAVMTQRPDVAKVALPMVGVLDMLRYHKFTIGWAWAVEYGSSDNEDEFNMLYKYSPLHQVKPAKYPATLIITADHDDRVVPAHSFKFGATLQQHQKGNNPILLRIDTKSGHGGGKPKTKLIEEWTDILTFTLYHLGVEDID